jgi:hypothetical protein
MCVMRVSFYFSSCFDNHANHFRKSVTLVTRRLDAPRSNGSGDQYSIKYLRGVID